MMSIICVERSHETAFQCLVNSLLMLRLLTSLQVGQFSDLGVQGRIQGEFLVELQKRSKGWS